MCLSRVLRRNTSIFLAAVLAIPALRGADPKLIDGLVSRYNEFGTFNGAVLAAANGEVIFKKAYGMANREWDIPNETDTRFRIGSITKQFTAALILQLVQEGKVRLDETLGQYVSEYPTDVAKRVTVHQLLTHTSGIKSYTGMPKFFPEISRDPYSPVEFLAFFAHEPLDFEPGERFSYNNSGYFLLGIIIEKVIGKGYAEALRERILRPLGMKNTGYDTYEALIPKRADGYLYRLDGCQNAAYLDMSLPYAAGALYSTVEDLYIWDRALAAGKVLSPEMSAKMFTPYVKMPDPKREMQYGYGWVIQTVDHPAKTGEELKLIGHGGGINGFNTLIERIPEDGHLIVIFNNTPAADLGEMAAGIRGVLYGRTPEPPLEPLSRELFRSYREGGIQQALARYQQIKETGGSGYDMAVQQLFRLAGYFEQNKQSGEEIAVLEIAAQDHLDRAEVFQRLGDALKRAGRRDDAVKAYAQALQIDPKAAPQIADQLKELTAATP